MEETIENQPEGAPAPITPEAPPVRTFESMNLDPAVKQALDEMGFLAPMEVQTAVYDRIIAGKDLMVQSRTGSGKTAAFGIPIAQLLQPGIPGAQALILAPTRELALQVAQEVTRISAYRNLQVVPVYGGAPMGRQIDALKAGAQIVAGTPGRVLDHIRRGTFKTDQIKLFVLDECDEMLSMGFQEEIEKIISHLPKKEHRQTMLFSATIPDDIERIGRRHMNDPEKVSLSEGYISVHDIDHQYYMVSGLGRTRDLQRILELERPDSALIFCNTREDTSMVAGFLQRSGYDAEAISGDLAQNDRERVMKRMRDKTLRFLVATDIAARGIDISDLPLVINYAFPESPEVYVHRTGRTGRAGRQGTAISMVGPREIGSFYYLKLLYKIKPEEREFPSERELKTRREAERYAKIVEEVPEDPGDEHRSLARRVLQAPDGERVLAALLKRVLDGTPSIVRDRKKEAAAEAELEKRQREEQVRRGERREPVAAADANADRPFERPKRDERGGPGGRREGGFRGREGGRDGGRGREGSRDARGGDRDRGPRRDDRGDRGPRRDDRPRPADAPRSEARPERPSLTPAEAPPPGGETREFWEAWVDEKGKQDQAAPAPVATGEQPAVEAASADAPTPRERAPRDRAPRDRAPREAREPRERAKPDEPGTVRLYLNVGKREGLQTDDVTRLVAESNAELAAAMGRVQVRDTHSYLSIKEELVDATIEALRGKKLGERELVVERARAR